MTVKPTWSSVMTSFQGQFRPPSHDVHGSWYGTAQGPALARTVEEDGGLTLNGAKVVKSLEFVDATKTGIIHEVDGLISPTILWRYADQLRIPGST
jgi:hypothetical protein